MADGTKFEDLSKVFLFRIHFFTNLKGYFVYNTACSYPNHLIPRVCAATIATKLSQIVHVRLANSAHQDNNPWRANGASTVQGSVRGIVD